jgi:hypothetical protein
MQNRFLRDAAAPLSSPDGARWLSKADRRVLRQRVALATEMGLHSVSLLGSVWTLHHPIMQHKPKARSASKGTGTAAATSRRSEKSAQRFKEYHNKVQTAVRFHLASLFKRWRQSTSQSPALLLPPPQPSLEPPPPSLPTTKLDTETRASLQQQGEQMDAGGRPKSGRSAPSAGDSPTTPHAKRALRLPSGPPPPSLPPSPPSPQGRGNLPDPSGSNQSGANTTLVASPAPKVAEPRARSSPRIRSIRMECPRCGSECESFPMINSYQRMRNEWVSWCYVCTAGQDKKAYFTRVYDPEEALARKIE